MRYADVLAAALRTPDRRERDSQLQQSVMVQPQPQYPPARQLDHERPGGHALEAPLLAPDDLIGSGLGKMMAKALTGAPLLLGATFPLMTPRQIDDLLGESAYANHGGRAKLGLTRMTPRAFLNSTTPTQMAQDQITSEAGRFDPFKFANERQKPFVQLDHPYDEVVGHEGRHRLAALAPYTDDVPVVVRTPGSQGLLSDSWENMGRREHRGQDFDRLGRGLSLRTGEVTPLAYDTPLDELEKYVSTVDVPLNEIGIALRPQGALASPDNMRAFRQPIPKGAIPRPPPRPLDVDMPEGLTEFERKHRQAQANATQSPRFGGLGLSPDNTAADRAAAMGMQDFYHGTKQDITDAFKPGYNDGLGFVTPDPKFASGWIGKGKHGQRIGDEAAAERSAAAQIEREIQNSTFDPRLSDLQGTDPEFGRLYDEMMAKRKALIREKTGGVDEYQMHSAVYPTKFAPQKTFHPDQNMDDMAEYFAAKGTTPLDRKYYDSGNYMMFETPDVVQHLKSKGYDSMMLKESTDGPYTTMAPFHPERIRSRFAAFDPMRRNEPDILGNIDPDLMKYLAGGATGAALSPLLIDALRNKDQP